MFSKSSFNGKRELLFEACKAGNLEKVHRIVADGVDPAKVVYNNFFDEVPLHWACRLVVLIIIM